MKIGRDMALVLLAAAAPVAAGAQDLRSGPYQLPYKNTYVKEVFVAENDFRTMKPETIRPRPFAEARKILPAPIWEGHDREIEMYWHAWRIAVGNIRQPREGSGFVSPYLDIAYNGNIFMWDASFMMMFARYGYRFFPFQRTLDNFYSHQHPDGFICREIRADGSDCFERYDPTSTGPNLLPWTELMYYRQFGDIDRLHKVFPALCAYAKWWKLNRTWPNGTYWSSGWGTGMDNTPRVPEGYNQIFSNGHMEWLDANLQQMLVNESLLQIGFYIERWQEIEEVEDENRFLKKHINDFMWNDEEGFLFDRYADGSLGTAKGIYAYWALQTDVLNKERLDRFVAHLSDSTEFDRPHRVPSLSADHRKYNALGRYWQGGVWPGANYMVIDGLWRKGYRAEAQRIAENHYAAVFEVWKNTGTFWEYYAPEKLEPGFMARKDFVGWTGLPPIAVFIEYILGIKSDYSERRIEWDLTRTEAHGIERYPFGPDGVVDLRVRARKSADETPAVTVSTNVPFELVVTWGDGHSSTVQVEKSGSVKLNQ
ncbi:MAG: glycoside hydrolase [Alistipes senegalensis]|uniref:MGH1-like glycoside hydrolase domain-containing protein n=1 Tax=Alistipes senegalensis TaxID=1288121 RepID=UPI0018991C55|nr:trehalase family glycosidase [Alistipes senegalensis]MBD9301586.1 glycoside hydrolase [Alistipes senegalensis]